MPAKTEPRAQRRWVTPVAATLVIAVVLAAFALSFTVLADLAAQSGIPSGVSWLWPVIADGTIAAATLVLYASRSREPRARRLPTLALALFALVSIIGNVAHILLRGGDAPPAIPWALKVFVGVVPPLGLLLTVEMLVSLLRSGETVSEATDVDEAAQTTAPAHVPEPVLAVEPPRLDPEPPTVAIETDPTTTETPSEPAMATTGDDDGALAIANDDASVDDEDLATGADDVAPAAVDPLELVPPLHAVERVPEDPDGQVEWILARARGGQDVAWRTLAQLLADAGHTMGDRTVQRRLAKAREQDPDAFAA